MDELSLNPEFLRTLLLNLRALMAQEELVSPNSGSNPTDDEGPATLQDDPDNLTHAEVVAAIEDLGPDQQSEIVALMWIGRGDYDAAEFAEAVNEARRRGNRRTAKYLLGMPMLGDWLEEGLEAIGA